ncbi:hypothetical protein N325_03616, partial [Colius striatus]
QGSVHAVPAAPAPAQAPAPAPGHCSPALAQCWHFPPAPAVPVPPLGPSPAAQPLLCAAWHS